MSSRWAAEWRVRFKCNTDNISDSPVARNQRVESYKMTRRPDPQSHIKTAPRRQRVHSPHTRIQRIFWVVEFFTFFDMSQNYHTRMKKQYVSKHPIRHADRFKTSDSLACALCIEQWENIKYRMILSCKIRKRNQLCLLNITSHSKALSRNALQHRK